MASIEPLKRRTAELEERREEQDLRGVTIIRLPHNGRDPPHAPQPGATIIIDDGSGQ